MADPFITVEELEDQLNRDLSDDEHAEFLCAAASDIVRTLTEQTLSAVEDEEIRLDGSGTDALVLPQVPVTGVSSVFVSDDELDPEDSGDAGEYTFGPEGVLLRRGGVWTRGRRNVTVTYSHGYDEVPPDLKAVALLIAERLLAQGAAESETLGQYTVRYTERAGDLSTGERIILAKYRR